jgi:hypothetical protein
VLWNAGTLADRILICIEMPDFKGFCSGNTLFCASFKSFIKGGMKAGRRRTADPSTWGFGLDEAENAEQQGKWFAHSPSSAQSIRY